MIEITFWGNVPSKKNGTQTIQRGSRKYQVPSKEFQAWSGCEIPRLKAQYGSPKLANFALELFPYLPSNRARDMDNLDTSILDVLKDGGVIKDDRHQCMAAQPWIHDPVVDPRNPRVVAIIHTDLVGFLEARSRHDIAQLAAMAAIQSSP